ncbi:hypothetical protein X740_29485 [Mesorhizobium sp. LNHC221B00]|nr:hypothetical protein X740_29485 [Mesorhizobium sp. LNHC221B00]
MSDGCTFLFEGACGVVVHIHQLCCKMRIHHGFQL